MVSLSFSLFLGRFLNKDALRKKKYLGGNHSPFITPSIKEREMKKRDNKKYKVKE